MRTVAHVIDHSGSGKPPQSERCVKPLAERSVCAAICKPHVLRVRRALRARERAPHASENGRQEVHLIEVTHLVEAGVEAVQVLARILGAKGAERPRT